MRLSLTVITLLRVFPFIENSFLQIEILIDTLEAFRVLKNKHSIEQDWQSCACNKCQARSKHSFFLKPTILDPIYEKLPILAHQSLHSVFAIF